MREIGMMIVTLTIGGVLGDILREWWGSGRRRHAVRLTLFVVAIASAFILTSCSSPPLDVRPPIARVS